MRLPTLRRSPLLPALLLSAAAPAAALHAQADPAERAAIASVDSLLRAMYPADGPGAAVLVARDGRVLLRQGYGMADVEMGVPVRPDHVFRIGSVTKQFTAVAILKLVEEGKISLDDDLTEHLPDFPTGGRRITVEQLLTHTSGIPSYTGLPAWQPMMRRDVSLDELIDLFENEPADFAPGEKWSYNNSAYILLGAIVEKASGMSYADFVRTRIFEPLGMTDSYYDETARIIPRRAEGYGRNRDGSLRNAEYLSMTQPYAAGSLLSTVDDLYRWQLALEQGKVLKPATLKRAFTPVTTNDGRATGYGYGWFIGEAAGHPTVEHGGDIHGFAAELLRVPDARLSVVVLSNAERSIANPEDATVAAVERLLGDGKEPARVALAPDALDAYVGFYRLGDRDYREITRDGDRLYSKRTGGERAEIVPVGRDEFRYPDSGTRARFERAGDGTIAAMVTRGRLGPETVAPRVDGPPPAPPVVAVPAEILDAYQGDYRLGPNFVITIVHEGGTLYAQPTGQPRATLLPESPTRFNLAEIPAAVEFHLDPSGAPVALVLHQGGRELRAERVK